VEKGIRQHTIDGIRVALLKHYPTLHLYREDGAWLVRGPFPVVVEDMIIDHYLIEILLPDDYPKSIPRLKEIGGRIPRKAAWHVYTNGYCCPFLPDERWKYWPRGLDIIDFLKGPVNDYFAGQTYRKLKGSYPFGERRHGKLGIIDYYSEELGTDDQAVIKKCLEYLSTPQPKGHWPCYCGSGERMRHCHFDKMKELHKKIDPRTASVSLSYWK
jgi:hypothetical protein